MQTDADSDEALMCEHGYQHLMHTHTHTHTRRQHRGIDEHGVTWCGHLKSMQTTGDRLVLGPPVSIVCNTHTNAVSCNTLQHTATHCNALQHCNTLPYSATHCNTTQQTTKDGKTQKEMGIFPAHQSVFLFVFAAPSLMT